MTPVGHLAYPSQTWHVTCPHAAPTVAELQEARRRVEHSGRSERAACQRGRLESRRTVQQQICVYTSPYTQAHTHAYKQYLQEHITGLRGGRGWGEAFLSELKHSRPERYIYRVSWSSRMPKNASSSKKFGKQPCIWFVFKPGWAVKSFTFEISGFQMKRDLSIKANVFFFSCNVLERMHPWAEFISAADLFSLRFCRWCSTQSVPADPSGVCTPQRQSKLTRSHPIIMGESASSAQASAEDSLFLLSRISRVFLSSFTAGHALHIR